MMTVLLESAGAREPRRAGWTLGSTVLHAALIVGAVALTTRAPQIADGSAEPVHVITFDHPEPIEQRPSRPPAGPVLPGAPALPAIPINIPNVPTFDVTRPFTSSAVAAEDIFRRPSVPIVSAAPGPAGVHVVGSVDRIAAQLPGNGSPDYPRTLRTAGVEGNVIVTFVVDTAGRAEPGSITIVSTTHALFADAVRHWLARTRYSPAVLDGQRVRQLVQQEVGFALKR